MGNRSSQMEWKHCTLATSILGMTRPTHLRMKEESCSQRSHRDAATPADPVKAVLGETLRQANDVPVAEAGRPYDDLQPGDVIAGRHIIQQWLDDVPLAHLYIARHTKISTLSYVLKVLKKEHLAIPELVDQFRIEAVTISKLRDPHTVRITDMGTLPDGRPFLCREYYSGLPLHLLIAKHGAQNDIVTRHIAIGVLRSLNEAHRHGIVHSAIQPRGIMLSEDPGSQEIRARVTDFSAAHNLNTQQSMEPEPHTESNPSLLLAAPQYTPAEYLRGQILPSADVYALGLTLAELLEGRPVYEPGFFLTVASQQLAPAPAPLGPKTLASALAPVIQRATNKDVAKRYANASEMLKDVLAVRVEGAQDSPEDLHAYLLDADHAEALLHTDPQTVRTVLDRSPDESGHDPMWAGAGALLENAPTEPRPRALETSGEHFFLQPQDTPTDGHESVDATKTGEHFDAFSDMGTSVSSKSSIRANTVIATPFADLRTHGAAPEHAIDEGQMALHPLTPEDVQLRTDAPLNTPDEMGHSSTAIMELQKLEAVATLERNTIEDEHRRRSNVASQQRGEPIPAPRSLPDDPTPISSKHWYRPVDIFLRILLILSFFIAGLAILLRGLP